jgi:hypothetical protein
MPTANAAAPNSRAHRRPRSGPALVMLPAGGCTEPVPDMPRGREWSDVDRERWQELWESPQASQWDDAQAGVVAMLVTYEQAIFSGTASAWHAQEARHIGEALGLTPRAMAALGWKLTDS